MLFFFAEFIKQNKSDTFKLPEIFRDENNKLRIKNWDSNKMYSRICFLLDDQKAYENYSKKLLIANNYEDKKKDIKNALKQFVNVLINT